MTFESEGLLIVAIYTWLPPASYVVFSENSGFTLGTTEQKVIFAPALSQKCVGVID